jgi:hypothetical protein
MPHPSRASTVAHAVEGLVYARAGLVECPATRPSCGARGTRPPEGSERRLDLSMGHEVPAASGGRESGFGRTGGALYASFV